MLMVLWYYTITLRVILHQAKMTSFLLKSSIDWQMIWACYFWIISLLEVMVIIVLEIAVIF